MAEHPIAPNLEQRVPTLNDSAMKGTEGRVPIYREARRHFISSANDHPSSESESYSGSLVSRLLYRQY